MRKQGEIIRLDAPPLTREEMMGLARGLLRGRFDEFVQNKEIDLTFRLSDEYRFRVNIFFQKDGVSAVLRIIPVKILTLEQLGLPPAVEKFVDIERGLVLVTGVTGSGKSTTLAAIIDAINSRHRKHIITIEDPIEFIHPDKQCLVNQRTIGEDTRSFANALRAALREDPDVILIGEMRDLETVEIALHAAETGHLVLSTLHTMDAKETINRIIGMFTVEEQNRIRLALASVIQGIISQRLIKTIDGKRTAAVEILMKTPHIVELIRTNRDHEIRDALEEGRQIYGTQTFDQSLLDHFFAGRISREEALRNATSPDDLALKMKGIGGASSTQESLRGQGGSRPIPGLKPIEEGDHTSANLVDPNGDISSDGIIPLQLKF